MAYVTCRFNIAFIGGIKNEITFIFKLHLHPIHLVVFVPINLSSVTISSAGLDLNSSGQLPRLGDRKKLRYSTRPAEEVKTTKGLQERTQLIEWDDGEA